MAWVDPFLAVVGGLLIFFLPGYTLTRLLWPERRVRGSGGLRTLLETVTLAFVLSVTLTVLVGYLLLTASPGGFQSYWSDPALEEVLAAVVVVTFVAGAVRGAYGRARSRPRPAEGTREGEEGAWELTRHLERLGRRERELERAIAGSERASPQETRLREELRAVVAERDDLRRKREDEYAA